MAQSQARRLANALEKRFPNNEVAPKYYGELLLQYAESSLRPPHLIEEIETGEEGKLWSYVWEAMLHSHLLSVGFEILGSSTRSGQNGPDFCVRREERKIWIEATVPSPEGVPSDYLEPPRPGEYRVRTKPDKERVLRCTSAITDKQKKLSLYREKGIIGEGDCTVIAVNICRLADWDVDGNGITQLPLAMEVVFPIGPIAVPISPSGVLAGAAQHTPRFSIEKSSGQSVPTANFLDATFANVSAILQAHQRDAFQKELILATVHNPLATVPLAQGLFGVYREFVAQETDDRYTITDIRASRSST